MATYFVDVIPPPMYLLQPFKGAYSVLRGLPLSLEICHIELPWWGFGEKFLWTCTNRTKKLSQENNIS
ncbi:uncharacterized protein J3R85_003979 [Psidium guajava]|nr:uncharacterized protein J3R85_003979 [Psidium guajava]